MQVPDGLRWMRTSRSAPEADSSIDWLVFAFHWTFWAFSSDVFLSVESKADVFSGASTGKILRGVGLEEGLGGPEIAMLPLGFCCSKYVMK